MELMLDARKGSAEDAVWEADIYPNPCVYLTSQIGNRATLQFGAERRIQRQGFRSLYFDNDYMRFNPDLPLEKMWDLGSSLQCRFTPAFTVMVGGFDKEIKDLTVFEEMTDGGIVSWRPNSRDSARVFGFRSGWELSLAGGRMEQSLEYIHEEHDQEIPYRPEDRGRLTVTCFAPLELELSVSGEFYGTRYVDVKDGDETETLSSYFLWKTRVSRTFGKYASLFVMAEFHVGQDDYQVWRGYGLPDQTIDFGLTLKF
jgi:outer membrane cobalamin receptor